MNINNLITGDDSISAAYKYEDDWILILLKVRYFKKRCVLCDGLEGVMDYYKEQHLDNIIENPDL